MVKKRLTSGEPCRKCVQAEELLRKRGYWERIDRVVWVDEADEDSEGMDLARRHQIDVAPFYVVVAEEGAEEVYVSALKLIKDHLVKHSDATFSSDYDVAASRSVLKSATSQQIVAHAFGHFGNECVIAFSGSDDVVLIDLAVQSKLSFSVVVVDTGRLHSETYRFIEAVRKHYGIEIAITSPEPASLAELVRTKGLFSFLEDGHKECCQLRKVEPLRRVLQTYKAWMTGQRKDQSLSTRSTLDVVEVDGTFSGVTGELVKFNPIANWSRDFLWQYIRDYDVPHNQLHHRGFVSIGCEPCTRPVLPGQHEREGRWWWEDEAVKECGLHGGRDESISS